MTHLNKKILNNQKGFTLIEIIAVLVILGILAAVAVPKFVDLTTKADEKAALAVFASLNSACSLNFAQGVLDPSATGYEAINNMVTLVKKLDPPGAPSGWSASGADLTKGTLKISVSKAETTGSARAELTKSGF